MYFDFTVEIPESKGKITRKKIKEVIYINYEYERIYKPKERYTIPKRTTIGKCCPEDTSRMYPNANFLKFFPDRELPKEKDRSGRSCCLRIGAYLIIQKIITDYNLEYL